MSLIFGVNLCDRVYISGDTRMSQFKNGKIFEKKDKIIKLSQATKYVTGAYAGDAHLASFVAKKIKKRIDWSTDIVSFRENIENLIGPIVDEYWQKHDSAAHIAIIFGGSSPKVEQDLSNIDIYGEVIKYQNVSTEKRSMELKEALLNEIKRKNGEEVSKRPAHTEVFSVLVDPPNNFEVVTTVWGEFLAYGPNGLSKEDIDPQLFGLLEFTNGKPGLNNAAITAILGSLAEKRKEETISQTFFTVVHWNEEAAPILGQISTLAPYKKLVSDIRRGSGDKYYSVNEKGTRQRLHLIEEYKDFSKLNLGLSL